MPETVTQLRESVATLREASSDRPEPGRMLIRLIEGDRRGSSGWYSNAVLQRDGAAAFPQGTACYIDHPTITEDAERPERSVRDLAARLTEDAHFDGDGLYAEIEVFPHWRPLVEGVADAIGMSIRAGGMIEEGPAPDGRARVVTRIEESNGSHSVDFVTNAGAGGRVMELLESAREVTLHEGHGMTASDLGDLLNDAVREEHGGDEIYVYVRDHTDTWVVFHRSADGESGLWQQNYTVTDGAVVFSGAPVEVVVHTEYRPAADTPVRTQTTVPSTGVQEDAMPDTPETELRESVTTLQGQVTQLTESVNTLTAERDTALTEVAQLRARDTARGRIAEALAADAEPLPATSQTRITEAVLADVPLTEAGELDTDALTEAITAAATTEREYVASLLEAAGVGRVRGLGSTGAGTGEAPRKPEDYQALGLSESAARVLSNR